MRLAYKTGFFPKPFYIYAYFRICAKFGVLTMATFTVSIPEDLKKRLDEHPEVNWPEYLKKRFEVRVREFMKFEELRRSGKL